MSYNFHKYESKVQHRDTDDQIKLKKLFSEPVLVQTKLYLRTITFAEKTLSRRKPRQNKMPLVVYDWNSNSGVMFPFISESVHIYNIYCF